MNLCSIGAGINVLRLCFSKSRHCNCIFLKIGSAEYMVEEYMFNVYVSDPGF